MFDSSRRLNLQILCTHQSPVRENLCIWPAFPIVIDCTYSGASLSPKGEDNTIAALEHPDRISAVRLKVGLSELENMITLMQQPFPLLTRLEIYAKHGSAPVFPGGFLGRSAPCLQEIATFAIPFPELPTLLLSTSNLVTLTLSEIPANGYISPEAMIVGLAALTRLEAIFIGFQGAKPHPGGIRPSPVTRIVLPSLTSFSFLGACDYVEDFVSRIDSPRLDQIDINYSDQYFSVPVQVAQLARFLDRSIGPRLTLLRHAQVCFFGGLFSITIYRQTNSPLSDWNPPRPVISCHTIYQQVCNMAQSFRQLSATLSNVVRLEIESVGRRRIEGDVVEWLHLLRQFPIVQSLYVSQDFARGVASALDDVAPVEMVAEVLPTLDLICLEGQPTSSVETFVAARQLSGRPITVVDTKSEYNERIESSFNK
jgi:hypothetical protein